MGGHIMQLSYENVTPTLISMLTDQQNNLNAPIWAVAEEFYD